MTEARAQEIFAEIKQDWNIEELSLEIKDVPNVHARVNYITKKVILTPKSLEAKVTEGDSELAVKIFLYHEVAHYLVHIGRLETDGTELEAFCNGFAALMCGLVS